MSSCWASLLAETDSLFGLTTVRLQEPTRYVCISSSYVIHCGPDSDWQIGPILSSWQYTPQQRKVLPLFRELRLFSTDSFVFFVDRSLVSRASVFLSTTPPRLKLKHKKRKIQLCPDDALFWSTSYKGTKGGIGDKKNVIFGVSWLLTFSTVWYANLNQKKNHSFKYNEWLPLSSINTSRENPANSKKRHEVPLPQPSTNPW